MRNSNNDSTFLQFFLFFVEIRVVNLDLVTDDLNDNEAKNVRDEGMRDAQIKM
jgi:hypothetical protein